MKIISLKSKLKKVAIKLVIAVVVAIAIFIFCMGLAESFIEDSKKVIAERDSLQSTISQKTGLYDSAKKDYEIFKTLNQNKKPSETGLTAAHERISEAIPVFDSLKTAYKFSELEFTISSTNPSTKVTSSIFEAFESPVTIQYKGVSDVFLFSFLNDLKSSLPGFIQINEIDIANDLKGDGTGDQKIDGYSLVSGKISANWITLKTKATN